MKEELLNRLDLLAAKLQTTTDYLFGVLVKQAHIEAMITLVQLGIALLVAIVCPYLCYKLAVIANREGDKRCSEQDTAKLVISVIGAIVTGLASVAAIVILLTSGTDWITPMYNPEYWALHKILEVLGK